MSRKHYIRILTSAMVVMICLCMMPSAAYAADIPGQSAILSLDGSASSKASVKVTWAKAKNAYGYSLYRATKEDGPYKRIRSTVNRSYTDTSVSGGKTYWYRVKAYRYVGGERVYGLSSQPKRVYTNYVKPPFQVCSTALSKDGRLLLNTRLEYIYSAGYVPTTLVYSELKRPFSEKKIFGVLLKNAVGEAEASSAIYLKYDSSRYERKIHSTGNTAGDFKYMKLTTRYPSASFYVSRLNGKALTSYNPQKDVLKFYILFRNKSYVIRYDAVNGIRTELM